MRLQLSEGKVEVEAEAEAARSARSATAAGAAGAAGYAVCLSLSPDLLGLEDEEVEVAAQLGDVHGELGGRAKRLALVVVEAQPGRSIGGLLLLCRLLAPPLEEHQLDEPASKKRLHQPCTEAKQTDWPRLADA